MPIFWKIFALASVAAPLAAAPLAAQTPMEIGETVTGTLEEGDPQWDDGAYYEPYVIRGRRGQTVMIRMSSADFDTRLRWGNGTEPYWMNVAENDDWGDGTDSRLVVRLGDEGEYVLRAGGFDKDDTGTYELRVTGVGPAPVAGTIRPGQTVEGELAETDYEGVGGYQDHYVIRGRTGDTITIHLRSEEFDPFVVFGAWRDGELGLRFEDDDSGPGTGAELVIEFFSAGEHRIVARSYSGDATGRYTLRVVAGAAPEGWDEREEEVWTDSVAVDPEVIADSVVYTTTTTDTVMADFSGMGWTVVPIEPGERVEESLDERDAADGDGRYYQQYTYQAGAGERLQIRVSSDDVDAYVMLGRGTHHQFEPLAEDDDGGPDLDAELNFTTPRAGEYTIHVTSASPGETGPFVLLLRVTR
ncbi:MAG TPA: hypothetical protein VHG08_27085 [Longimicrobium sp.]|nr:hypothetical protein [Longimicrobium sp.]